MWLRTTLIGKTGHAFWGIVAVTAALSTSACGTGAASQPSTATQATTTSSASSTTSSASSSNNDDTFDQDRERIRSTVPGWDEGTGATIRFLKESTGSRLSLIFVDTTAPAFKQEANLWMIQAQAKVNGGKVVGHFVLLLKDLKPGSIRGDAKNKDVVAAVLVGEKWNGSDPEASWSINEGGWCELTLRDAGNGNLDGDFRGKLVDNKGSGFINVESGYIYINR